MGGGGSYKDPVEAPTFGYNRDYRLRFGLSLLSSAVFSYVPAIISTVLYCKVSYVLAQRKKKMGRNVNLVMAFCFTCFIWIVSLMVKLSQDLFELYAELKLPPWERYRFPVENNIFASSILSFSPCFTSIFSLFILFVVQKNYRKPIADFFKKIRGKICN